MNIPRLTMYRSVLCSFLWFFGWDVRLAFPTSVQSAPPRILRGSFLWRCGFTCGDFFRGSMFYQLRWCVLLLSLPSKPQHAALPKQGFVSSATAITILLSVLPSSVTDGLSPDQIIRDPAWLWKDHHRSKPQHGLLLGSCNSFQPQKNKQKFFIAAPKAPILNVNIHFWIVSNPW